MSKGLHVNVLRPANGWDSTNGGVSSQHTSLTIVGVLDATREWWLRGLPAAAQVFEPTADAPAAWLKLRRIGGRDVWSVVPAMTSGDPDNARDLAAWDTQWMAGGNYAATTDSRIAGITQMYGAIAIHDRTES